MKITTIKFKCPHCGNQISDIRAYDSPHLSTGKLAKNQQIGKVFPIKVAKIEDIKISESWFGQ